jgi:GT2 family glycosyltransferase
VTAGPDVSLVVVNYRTEDMTAGAVRAARAAAPGLSLEVVVVDNGSTPQSAARLEAALPDATVVARTENRGFAAGVNAGLAVASGRTLLLLNSDAFPRDNAVTRLVDHLDAHPGAGVVAPRVEGPDGELQFNAYRRFPNLVTLFFDFCLLLHPLAGTRLHPHTLPRARFEGPAGRVAHATGAALLVRREAAHAAGPLDEGYFLYLEETEWLSRITAAGWEVHLEPAAVVVHADKGSDPDSQVFSPHYFRSAERYYRSPGAARRVMRAGARVSLPVAAAAAALRPRDPRFSKLKREFARVLREVPPARAGSSAASRAPSPPR